MMVVVVAAAAPSCLALQCPLRARVQLATRPTALSLLMSWVGLAVDKEPALSSHHVAGRAQPPQGRPELHGCVPVVVGVGCVGGGWVGGCLSNNDDDGGDGARGGAQPGPAVQPSASPACSQSRDRRGLCVGGVGWGAVEGV